MAKQQKTFYKVVNVIGKRRISVFAPGRYRTTYRKGDIVTGKGLGLMCFKTHYDARQFMNYAPAKKLEIIKVKALCEPSEIPFFSNCYAVWAINDYMRILDMWDNVSDLDGNDEKRFIDTIESLTNEPPAGTVCFKKIKVLE